MIKSKFVLLSKILQVRISIARVHTKHFAHPKHPVPPIHLPGFSSPAALPSFSPIWLPHIARIVLVAVQVIPLLLAPSYAPDTAI